MYKIALTGERFAIVDKNDYEFLNSFKWHCTHFREVYGCGIIKSPYARGIVNGKNIQMHRLIMNAVGRKDIVIDHRNRNSLDNRRSNLRICTIQLNNANRRKQSKPCTSQFKGVYFNKQYSRWMARIKYWKKYIFLGRFDEEKDAARAYNKKAKELFGEFACLNKI